MILTGKGDHKAAVTLFEEAEHLYTHIDDEDGANMMRDKIHHVNVHAQQASSSLCTVS